MGKLPPGFVPEHHAEFLAAKAKWPLRKKLRDRWFKFKAYTLPKLEKLVFGKHLYD